MSTMAINNPFIATQMNGLSSPGNKAVQSAVKPNGIAQQSQISQKTPEFIKKINKFFQQFLPKNIEKEGTNSKLVQKLAKFSNHTPAEVLAKMDKIFKDTRAFKSDFKSVMKNCGIEIKKLAKYFKK